MLNKTTLKTKCDVTDCKNLAECYVAAKGKIGKFFLCADCLQKIATEASLLRPPKSPKNTIKKIIEQKEAKLYE
ncbi:MAG: hypothetical protein NC132_04595 [Corallococcus sp.]|nr:hypothetical protein [Corallococcus sp.]MCM1359665.1 hypothetical protein [Corallococcus sp.]MCM1395374.1 hypothetical protein [Corallococcus sp.]